MLRLTYQSGQKLERVFAGNIGNEADLEKFVRELKEEIKQHKTSLFCEIWEDVTSIGRRGNKKAQARERKAMLQS